MTQMRTCVRGAAFAPTSRPYRVQIDWGMISLKMMTAEQKQ